jgi:selenide,water dikinase
VGFETGDDAAVFDLGNGTYLVQTVDFITPVVDDPYLFGRISANNSISDVYAMGGRPVTALSVFMLNCALEKTMIQAMMQGAADECAKAGAALCGGHTIADNEIKLGFSVTGVIEDKRFYRNYGLRTGDVLIYTKKLGIGLVTTALKAGMATDEHIKSVTETMLISNGGASKLLRSFDVSACTDVTGFGMAGHGSEVANGSGKTITFDSGCFTYQEGAKEYASQFIIPAGAYGTMEFVKNACGFTAAPDNSHMLFFDPQTSGGLLIGVSEDDAEKMVQALRSEGYPNAAVVGIASEKTDKSVVFV